VWGLSQLRSDGSLDEGMAEPKNRIDGNLTALRERTESGHAAALPAAYISAMTIIGLDPNQATTS
jgi:hypothetical protein